MIIPPAYDSQRNRSNAYRRGYRAGTIADVGGVPLAPYTKRAMVCIFEAGFEDAQKAKDQSANPRAGDGADALAYALAASSGFDPARGDDQTVFRRVLIPTPRERELLAFLERLQKDIAAVLQGGIR